MDDKERIGSVIEKMIADGASHEEIMAFLPQAKAHLRTGQLRERHNSNLAEIADLKKANPENSFGDYVRAGTGALWDKAKGMGRGALALVDAAANPVPTLVDDSKRRELVRGVDDMVSLGYGQQLGDWLADKLGAEKTMAATAEDDAARAPDYRAGGGIVGSFLPGAASVAFRGGGRLARAALPSPTGVAAATRAGLTYELAAPAISGAHASAEGRRLDAARETATDPAGLLLGTVPGAVAATSGAVSRTMRRNPTIARYAAAREAGVYREPAMRQLPKGADAGNQAASEEALARVLRRERALGDEAGARYQSDLNPPAPEPISRPAESPEVARESLFDAARRVDAPAPMSEQESLFAAARRVDAPAARPERPPSIGAPPPIPGEPPPAPHGLERQVNRQALLAEMRAGQRANINPDTGLPNNAAVDARFEDAIASLGDGARPTTVGGVLGQRRALQKQANFGNLSPTPTELATRDVYQTFRGGVRKAAPDVAAADDAFADFARLRDRRRDILYGSESEVAGGAVHEPAAKPDIEAIDEPATPQLRVGKEKAGARLLGRVNDTNKPGLEARRYIEELSAADPQIADAIRFVAAKKDFEATRFGLDGGPAPTLHKAVSLGGVAHVASRNTRAIGAQIVDPLAATVSAQSLRLSGPLARLPAVNRVHSARQAERERNRKRAEALLARGR